VYNILSAIGVGISLGFGTDSIARGIEGMKAVPGRMEKVDEGQPFGVVVDYAHTEDSLAGLLDAVRGMTKGRVITVFGCGGDRDRTKRPKMGAAAIRGSDVVIITSDNPRTEEPLSIIREIETGMEGLAQKIQRAGAAPMAADGKKPYYVMPDRRDAVAEAIRMARSGDMVVLAGKGHEDYQIIGEKKVPFDDREVARTEIRKRQMTGVR
ncbi:MAG TPA: cyanophycin synthetase, partial [Nitrospirota bacterium]